MERLVNRRVVQAVVMRHSFLVKKQLGQNFLINDDVLDQIVGAAKIRPNDAIFEIGPGIGTLTQALCESGGLVVAVEKDRKLQAVLQETLASYDNVSIVWGDVLEIDLQEMFPTWFGTRRVNVVANLPYYITTPIIMKILESRIAVKNIVVMVQKEVAERIVAVPGGKDYGVLSVAAQYYADASIVCHVPSDSFFPSPAVDSAVIRLQVRDHAPISVDNESFFFDIVKSSFAQRRKTIQNNLSHRFTGQWDKEQIGRKIESAGIDPTRRGETLSLEEFAHLARCFGTR